MIDLIESLITNPEYYIISLLLSGFIAIISGVIVYLNDQKRLEGLSWLGITFSSAIWSFGYFATAFAPNHGSAIISDIILHLAASLIPFFYLLFILILTDNLKKHKFSLFITGLLAIFFIIVTPTKLFVQDVFAKFIFNFVPNAGPIYIYFTIYFFGTVLYALIILLYNSFVQKSESLRLKLVFLSSVTGFIGGGSVFLLTFNVGYPYPLILFSFYPIIIGYAVLRHHLFKVKIVTTELLTFVIWIFLFLRTLLETDAYGRILDASLLILLIFFGILLIRSVIREVEQREKLELLSEELEKANEELKKLDVMKSEFISLASHQLRAPLTIIKGYNSMILEGTFGSINDQAKDALGKVMHSANQLVKLVDDLLNLSRIESGKIKYDFKMADFTALVQNTLDEIKPDATKKDSKIIFINEAKNLPQFIFDTDKMREVVINLTDNAIKYSPPKSEVIIKMEEMQGKPDNWVRLSVIDKGLGIKKEDLGKLFTKFSRSEEARKQDPNGMGIGIYFVKRVIEDHGGKVGVESEGLGKGSTFWEEIPVVTKYQSKEEFVG